MRHSCDSYQHRQPLAERSNMVNSKHFACARCHRKEDSANKLTWQMSREDITVRSEDDALNWIKGRVGLPSVIVLPDDGGFLAYSVVGYCDSCLNEQLKEYEEQHTPADEVTRGEFQEKVVQLFHRNGWTVYSLQLDHLAPRGFPNLALIKDDQLLLRSLSGDVTVRLRAFHHPAQTAFHHSPHSLLISPEVPQEIQETLLRSSNQEQIPHTVAFLYMDEKYLDVQAPPEMQVTSLAGLLVTADTYPRLRDRLFRILPGSNEGAGGFDIEVHASDLFRDRPDEEHFAFYRDLVSIVNELDCRIYRRGFNFIPGHQLLRKNEKDLLGLCFRSMLIAADDFERDAQIWPVMEIDHTEAQDLNFAGYVRWADQATAHLQMTGDGVEELIDDDYMVDNSRVGDLHYVSKKSIVGCAVDCLVYLLHCKWLNEMEFPLTEYKARLAEIAASLHPSVVDDYVGSFQLDVPPTQPGSAESL